ncbi:serine-rich adhesin for platelets [Hyalella azteca]|uniref:Serine-rich adhesin for platelets n=1 Tax=Hyalella azteca TaxID=294128 RepID=A0A8B7PCA5_HYAAZ|nr:serine-rich adhesin for platelets [Hyalella azteca]
MAASPPALAAKREPFSFTDTKFFKKERHPSGPAASSSGATVILSPSSISCSRNNTSTTSCTFSTSTGTSVTPHSLSSPLSHWPLPPTPCTPTMPVAPTLPPSHTPFWLSHHMSPSLSHHTPHHQFAPASPHGMGGLDATSGGSSSGPAIGYHQFVTDPISRHLILVHHAALQDVSSNLMWGYSGVAPLMSPQMLLADPHFPRPLHSALLHASALHPALHPPTPTLLPPTPTLHPASSIYSQMTGSPAGGLKMESPKASPKGLEEGTKSLLHGTASVRTSSTYPGDLQSVMSPIMSAGLATGLSGLSGLPSSMTPGLTSPLSSAMPSVLSSVLPTGLASSGLAPALQPPLPSTLPHYLYPSSSHPLFCPKPPMYPLSAFVQTPTSPAIPVITSDVSATTDTSPSSHNSVLLGISKDVDTSLSSFRASMSLPTPPTIVVSPQLSRSPLPTKKEKNTGSAKRRSSTPTVVQQPKSSPHFASKLSSSHSSTSNTDMGSLPKIKLDKLHASPSQSVAHNNSTCSTERSAVTSKISIKKEIKEEYMSPVSTLQKGDGCVDLSISCRKISDDDNNNSGSIKQESGVPDSTKNSSNQSGVAISSTVSSVNHDGSGHLPSLTSSPVVPNVPSQTKLNDFSIPLSCVGVTTATTSITTTVSSSAAVSVTTTTTTSTVPTYRHLSVQTVPIPHLYRYSERSLSVGASVPVVAESMSSRTSNDTENVGSSASSLAPSTFAPVQEQALDLSGLELLSRSVLQHANRLSSEEPVDYCHQEPTSDQPLRWRSSSCSGDLSSASVATSAPFIQSLNRPLFVPGSVDENFYPQADAPLNFSISASNGKNPKSDRIEATGTTSSLPPSSAPPTSSRNNFIFLCALAEEELLKGDTNEKDSSYGHLKPNASSCETPNCSDVRRVQQDKEISFLRPPLEKCIPSIQPDLTLPQPAAADDAMSLSFNTSSDADVLNSPCKENGTTYSFTQSSSSFSESFLSCSSPLDLSLGMSKKTSKDDSWQSGSTKDNDNELSASLHGINSDSTDQAGTSDGNRSCESLVTEKLLGTYDSSSSDGQNFEGFEDASLKRTEENMRRQLVVLAKQYREKVRQVQRQFPKSEVCSSTHKSRRPSKRKRFPSESSSRRSDGRHAKHRRCEDGRKRLTSLPETASFRRSSEDSSEAKSVPALSISKLKSKNLVSPRREPRRSEQRSSTDEGNESSDDEMDNLPRRKWSLSFLSNDSKSQSSYKSQLMSTIVRNESDDEAAAGNDSDSSEANSKALYTETSAVESSDHETTFLPCSSSKKRKPGRPKKHSPTKKDATETIVTKKHKNLNLLLRHSSLATSKSKVKPKLNAEAREIICDAVDSSDAGDNSCDETNGNLDVTFLKNVESLRQSNTHSPDVQLAPNPSMKVSTLVTSTPIPTMTPSSCPDATKRRKVGGSSSLTRRAIMRDKAKRKTDVEQQHQMEALFRSLKKRSTLANAEHDESEEEQDGDYDSDQSGAPSTAVSSSSAFPLSAAVVEDAIVTAPVSHGTSTDDKAVAVKTETAGDDLASLDVRVADATSLIVKEETAKDTNKATSIAADTVGAAPLGLHQLSSCNRIPSVCHLAVEELVKGCRVLLLRDDGLLYAGSVNPISPPNLYGLLIDGERGSKGHIYCAEELLTQAWKEVKPGSTRFLKEGTRVCCFWSQQYRALYSGTVGSPSSSPAHSDASSLHNFVNVEFDDGDSGRIHVDDIRLLPPDYPVTVPKPNPLLTLCTRKRRAPQRDSTDSRPGAPHDTTTSVKLTVSTSASGMCRVTSSTTSSVHLTQLDIRDEASRNKKKNKAKKKKKASLKKQQKRLSREWDHESDKDSDVEGEELKPKIKKIKLCETDGKKTGIIDAALEKDFNDLDSKKISEDAHWSSGHFSEHGKYSKKKKKKHKSEESCHKKRKHKHKRNKNKHESNEPLVYEGRDLGNTLTIHSNPAADINSNQTSLKLFPHVEQMDGDLRVRIKSPPPSKVQVETSCRLEPTLDEGLACTGSALGHPSPHHETSAIAENVPAEIADAKSVARCDRDSSLTPGVVSSQRLIESREKAKKSRNSSNDTKRPKRSSSRAESITYDERSDDDPVDDEESSGDEEPSDGELTDGGKTKFPQDQDKMSGNKSRHHSGRSKIAAFLPEKELWQWSGRGSKKTTGKGRGRKIFYKEIVRGDENIRVGDCCVFRSSGPPDNPYIGRIEHLCEGWGGSKTVTVHWFYHPNEIQDEPKKLKQPKGALFESNHRDTNDLQTISYKCQVLPLDEYRARHNLRLTKLKVKNNQEHQAENTENNTSRSSSSGLSCSTCSVSTDALSSSVEALHSCTGTPNKNNEVILPDRIDKASCDVSVSELVNNNIDIGTTAEISAAQEEIICSRNIKFTSDENANEDGFKESNSFCGEYQDAGFDAKKVLSCIEDTNIPLDLDSSDMQKEMTSVVSESITKMHNENSTKKFEIGRETFENRDVVEAGANLNVNDNKTLKLDSTEEIAASFRTTSTSEANGCDVGAMAVSKIPGDPAEALSDPTELSSTDLKHEDGTGRTNGSASSTDSSSCEDSDDESDVLSECYYLAGTYDVTHQVLRMEPGVE